jgi:hypothetical protein
VSNDQGPSASWPFYDGRLALPGNFPSLGKIRRATRLRVALLIVINNLRMQQRHDAKLDTGNRQRSDSLDAIKIHAVELMS